MTVGCGGCRIGDRDIVVSGSIGSSKLFWIGNKSCSSREAMVYLANYQNIYGTSCGVDLWQHDFGDDSLEQYVKDITIGELAQVICMDQLAENINTGQSAEEQGISLDDNELEQINLAAKEYFSSLSEAEIAYMDGVSENDINEYYQHYALAQKLYHSLTAGVNGEVSDDEARVIEIMQIFVSGKEAAEEVEEKLAAGEDFASLANNYNELSAIQITVARDDLPEAVEQVAFELDNDAVSDVIPVENGYYFIKCLNKYDVELTEANKSNIVEKREKEAFDDIYNAFVAELSSGIDRDFWDALELNTSGEIQTDSFFEVFEKYCSEI
jgi:foldase protein PrsA